MKRQEFRLLSGLVLCVLAVGISISWAASPGDVPRMAIETLKELMEDSETELVILDVRTGSSWAESDVMIKAAIREDPEDFNSWSEKYPQDKTFVLYCT